MSDTSDNGPSLREYVEKRFDLLSASIDEKMKCIEEHAVALANSVAAATQMSDAAKTKAIDAAFSSQQLATMTAFTASEKAVSSALEAAKEAVNAALAAADRAVTKTEASTTKQFDALGVLNEQRFKSLADKIDGTVVLLQIAKGKEAGQSATWGTVGAVIAIVISVLGVIFEALSRTR